MQKGFSAVLILILILIVGAGALAVKHYVFDNVWLDTFPTHKPTTETQIDKPDNLEVNIENNQEISSPFQLTGTVPAGWMFEGSFPITILNENENIVVQSFGEQIEGENWMSGNPVKFKATILFNTIATSGFVRLAKDNPSGLPENDAHYDIPVKFTSTNISNNVWQIDNETVATLLTGYKVTDNGDIANGDKIYTWRLAGGPGLCPFDEYEAGDCNYTDEKIPLTNTFRVWKDKSGIFALNPQSIKVSEEHYVDLVIQKRMGNFTNTEINDWKQIINSVKSN